MELKDSSEGKPKFAQGFEFILLIVVGVIAAMSAVKLLLG